LGKNTTIIEFCESKRKSLAYATSLLSG
jgi:hypothetical protein